MLRCGRAMCMMERTQVNRVLGCTCASAVVCPCVRNRLNFKEQACYQQLRRSTSSSQQVLQSLSQQPGGTGMPPFHPTCATARRRPTPRLHAVPSHRLWYGGVLHAIGQVDGELGGAECVHQAGPVGQALSGRRSPDESPLAGLGHAKVAGVEHAKANLWWWRGVGMSGSRVGDPTDWAPAPACGAWRVNDDGHGRRPGGAQSNLSSTQHALDCNPDWRP